MKYWTKHLVIAIILATAKVLLGLSLILVSVLFVGLNFFFDTFYPAPIDEKEPDNPDEPDKKKPDNPDEPIEIEHHPYW